MYAHMSTAYLRDGVLDGKANDKHAARRPGPLYVPQPQAQPVPRSDEHVHLQPLILGVVVFQIIFGFILQ